MLHIQMIHIDDGLQLLWLVCHFKVAIMETAQ